MERSESREELTGTMIGDTKHSPHTHTPVAHGELLLTTLPLLVEKWQSEQRKLERQRRGREKESEGEKGM